MAGEARVVVVGGRAPKGARALAERRIVLAPEDRARRIGRRQRRALMIEMRVLRDEGAGPGLFEAQRSAARLRGFRS
jgi:hypothetical protein